MLTPSAIHDLQGIADTLQIPFAWGEDAQGVYVDVGGGLGQKCVCRSVREAIACIASEVEGTREDIARIRGLFFPMSKLRGLDALIESRQLNLRWIEPTD